MCHVVGANILPWTFFRSVNSTKSLTPSQRIGSDVLAGCPGPSNIGRWRGWDDLVGRDIHRRYCIFSTHIATVFDMIHEDNVPLRDVAMWRSYVNMAATTGRSAGGPVGGLFADTIGWRWSMNPVTALEDMKLNSDRHAGPSSSKAPWRV